MQSTGVTDGRIVAGPHPAAVGVGREACVKLAVFTLLRSLHAFAPDGQLARRGLLMTFLKRAFMASAMPSDGLTSK